MSSSAKNMKVGLPVHMMLYGMQSVGPHRSFRLHLQCARHCYQHEPTLLQQ